MVPDNNVFTLASVSELPITKMSRLQVITIHSENVEVLFYGTFKDFQEWLIKNDKANPYAEVKKIINGTIVV